MGKKPWTIGKVLSWTEEYFMKQLVSTSRLDAELLLAHTLKVDRMYLYINYDQPLDEFELHNYKKNVSRRGKREPLAYILGYKEFYKLKFFINKYVLIPRPETEILVEIIIKICKMNKNFNLLELGVGSGNITVSILKNCFNVNIVAVDISKEALKIAHHNAYEHGVLDKVVLNKSNWFANIENKMFDIIVSNPPYIKKSFLQHLEPELHYEPLIALTDNNDGLSCYYAIINEAYKYLAPKGILLFEIGIRQENIIKEYINNSGKYGKVSFVTDYAEINRVIIIENKIT